MHLVKVLDLRGIAHAYLENTSIHVLCLYTLEDIIFLSLYFDFDSAERTAKSACHKLIHTNGTCSPMSKR